MHRKVFCQAIELKYNIVGIMYVQKKFGKTCLLWHTPFVINLLHCVLGEIQCDRIPVRIQEGIHGKKSRVRESKNFESQTNILSRRNETDTSTFPSSIIHGHGGGGTMVRQSILLGKKHTTNHSNEEGKAFPLCQTRRGGKPISRP